MAKVIKITDDGLKKLEEELEYLKTEGRADIAEKIKVARGYGDLSENSEYDEAKNDKISDESPVGKALLGKKIGEEVIVEAPGGEFKLKILGISK